MYHNKTKLELLQLGAEYTDDVLYMSCAHRFQNQINEQKIPVSMVEIWTEAIVVKGMIEQAENKKNFIESLHTQSFSEYSINGQFAEEIGKLVFDCVALMYYSDMRNHDYSKNSDYWIPKHKIPDENGKQTKVYGHFFARRIYEYISYIVHGTNLFDEKFAEEYDDALEYADAERNFQEKKLPANEDNENFARPCLLKNTRTDVFTSNVIIDMYEKLCSANVFVKQRKAHFIFGSYLNGHFPDPGDYLVVKQSNLFAYFVKNICAIFNKDVNGDYLKVSMQWCKQENGKPLNENTLRKKDKNTYKNIDNIIPKNQKKLQN